MSESVTVIINDEIKNINENKVEILISKTCNSLIINNNELEYCKKIFKTEQNSIDIYCNEHKFKNNMCKDIVECCICFEIVNKTKEIPLNCGHLFHKECLLKTEKTICPICKSSFTEIELNYIKYKKEIKSRQTIVTVNQENCDYIKLWKVGLFTICVLLTVLLIKFIGNV
jgi:hypothetical protein